MLDDATGSEWNFQGCAISGKAKGLCLEPVPMLKDYWFDWRNYNPKTTVLRQVVLFDYCLGGRSCV